MKREIEIQNSIVEKREQMEKYKDEGKIKEAFALLNEIKDLKMELEVERGVNIPVSEKNMEPINKANSLVAFNKAVKGMKLTDAEAALVEKNGEDGGYLVPEEQRTQIEELKRSLNSLKNYCNVVPVSTLSGSFPLEVEENGELLDFDEMDEISSGNVKFGKASFKVKTKGVLIPLSKQLLADAGYPDGFDIDMPVCDLDMEGVLLTDLAQKVKDDLSQIGINVNIVSQPWAAGFGDDYRDGKIGFTVMYWSTDYNDPNVQLEFLPGQSVGLRAGWTTDMDPDLAQLYADTLNATDNDARIAVLEKIQDDTYENGPWLMIAQAPAHIAYNTRLDGVAASDPYSLDLTQITIK